MLLLCVAAQFIFAVLCNARKVDHPINDVLYPMVKKLSEDLATTDGNLARINQTFNMHFGRILHLSRIANDLGGKAYSKADRKTKLTFRSKVKQLIYKVYSKLYLPTTEVKVMRFYSMHDDYETAKSLVIHGIVDEADGTRTQVHYFLLKNGSRWRIIDVGIGDESIVESFRHLFRFHLQSGDLKYLLKQLKSQPL